MADQQLNFPNNQLKSRRKSCSFININKKSYNKPIQD